MAEQPPLAEPTPSTTVTPQAGIRVEFTDLSGQKIETVRVGQSFKVEVFIDDLRATKLGAFYAMVDVEFDSTLADLGKAVELLASDVRTDRTVLHSGLIDDVGGVLGFNQPTRSTWLLFTAELTATQAGQLTFNTSPGEATAGQFLLLNQRGTPVSAEEVTFGTGSLTIMDEAAALNAADPLRGWDWCGSQRALSTDTPPHDDQS